MAWPWRLCASVLSLFCSAACGAVYKLQSTRKISSTTGDFNIPADGDEFGISTAGLGDLDKDGLT
jgi:hypothetical protein